LAEAHQGQALKRIGIVLAEAHSIPKFHGELFFRSGNAAVADRAPGLAEMTATVVRTGTAKRASRQIEEGCGASGGSFFERRSDTSAIRCGPFGICGAAARHGDELAREAAFPEAEFERERRQKLEK